MKGVSNIHKSKKAIYDFGKRDMLWEYSVNPNFRDVVDTGNYVYLDGKICLNSQDCLKVKKGIVTVKTMTRKGLSEYCVAKLVPKKSLKDRLSFLSFPAFRFRSSRRYRRDRRGMPTWGKPALGYRARKRSPYNSRHIIRRRQLEYLQAKKLPNIAEIDNDIYLAFVSNENEMPYGTFGEGVKFFLKREGMTQEDLAEKIGVTPETISRLCRDVYNTSINLAIAVCVGFHLLPYESRSLISRLGYTLDGCSPSIKAYRMIIDIFYMSGVAECNSFLISKGLKPLTNLKE